MEKWKSKLNKKAIIKLMLKYLIKSLIVMNIFIYVTLIILWVQQQLTLLLNHYFRFIYAYYDHLTSLPHLPRLVPQFWCLSHLCLWGNLLEKSLRWSEDFPFIFHETPQTPLGWGCSPSQLLRKRLSSSRKFISPQKLIF